MKKVFKESGHLVRLALAMAFALLIFLLIRQAVVPAGFGKYGHYRAGTLTDVRARSISFASHATCEACHDEVATKKAATKHAKVACEACHGALAKHAEDPSALKPVRPDFATLCVRCHEADSAKPKTFPQVVSKDHSQGNSCGACHNPHSPKMS
jgi:hypothetical protein